MDCDRGAIESFVVRIEPLTPIDAIYSLGCPMGRPWEDGWMDERWQLERGEMKEEEDWAANAAPCFC